MGRHSRKPSAFDSVRQKQFIRYVDYIGYRTGLKFNLRPHQLADFKTSLAEMTLSTASQKWNPCGGSNVATFCQSVGELKRRELVRKLMRDHKLEVAADNLGRLLLESGEKVRLVRDWDNDPDEEKASVLDNLPSGGFGRYQFKAKFVAMDYEELCRHLEPEAALIFKALVLTRGNVEAARRHLNEEVYRTERYRRTKFAERTVPALRCRLRKIYFFRRGEDFAEKSPRNVKECK